MKPCSRKLICLIVAACVGLAASGCRSLGPRTIPKDRADYSEAIGDSWMRQTLLNIVKLRYNTAPVFVDVASIVGGYSTESEVGGALNFAWPNAADVANINGKLRFTDRPTITYTPLTGGKFMRSLITPIRPEELFFTIQSGWNAGAILTAGAASINGLRNREQSPEGALAADPDFIRVVQLMGKIQQSGCVGIRIIQDAQKHQTTLLTFHNENMPAEVRDQIGELRRLLRLDPAANEFQLVYGSAAASSNEIAVRSRSLIQIMGLMAAEMEVPEAHIKEGRTTPGPQHGAKPLARIRCSSDKPGDALVAVKYRGHWFWVDDRDVSSKRGFGFIMLLFTLADAGEQQNLPLITIPAQ